MSRRVLVAVVTAAAVGTVAAAAYAGISGKGTLTKVGGTTYSYSVQFTQPVTAFQIRFKAGVTVTSFTAPSGFECSNAYDPSTKQHAIACPTGKAAANHALKGTVKLGSALPKGGATLYEAGAKLVGPFAITGP